MTSNWIKKMKKWILPRSEVYRGGRVEMNHNTFFSICKLYLSFDTSFSFYFGINVSITVSNKRIYFVLIFTEKWKCFWRLLNLQIFLLQGHLTGARPCCKHMTEQNIFSISVHLILSIPFEEMSASWGHVCNISNWVLQ